MPLLTSRTRLFAAAVIPLCLATLSGCLKTTPISVSQTYTGKVFYVDCNGSDAAAGTDPTSAWQSIAKANKATLGPGDAILFKTGCTWSGSRLEASWTGTAGSPVTIGSYGTGTTPKIRNNTTRNLMVTGSYQVIQDLELSYDVKSTAACGQPVGSYYDLTLDGSANHNTVQRMTITTAMTGVLITEGASQNRIVNNTIANNNVMQVFGGDPDAALGAWGVLVNGDDNEITQNYFHNNFSVCPTVADRYPGNSVEIYGGSRNNIHHNRAYGDTVFSELGGSSTRHPVSNIFAYNLFVTNQGQSRFIITRGLLDTRYGPVNQTTVAHNTTYQTGAHSQGVVCGSGCTSDILTLSGNILWAEEKALFSDQPFTERNNLYWDSAGAPMIQMSVHNADGTWTPIPLAPTSKVANPLFVAASSNNFALQAKSPAIDAAGPVGAYPLSLNNLSLPQGPTTDIGAFEYLPGT
jgi:hypothetical protein